MSKRKRVRRTSTDDWPTEPEPPQTEGPLVKFPDAKNAKTVPDLLILDPGIPYTGTTETFVTTDVLELAQLAVLKMKKNIFRAVQLNSKTHTVYMVISAEVERSLIQKHVRVRDRKVNYRLWYDNSLANKKPQSEADRLLFGQHCFLSSALCQTLKSERAEKSERRPKRDTSKTVELTVSLKTTITVSSADALAILAGTKQLVVADKAKNDTTNLSREG